MKKIQIAFAISCLVIASWVILALMSAGKQEMAIAYINNQEVYQEFGLTKDLQKNYEKTFVRRKITLDSLETKLSGLAKKVELENGKNKEELNRVTVMQEEYMTLKRQVEEEAQETNGKYQAQILDQMNEYLTQFGKEKGLKLLLGANGSGEIMYADGSMDLTKEAIAYINKQYNGKK